MNLRFLLIFIGIGLALIMGFYSYVSTEDGLNGLNQTLTDSLYYLKTNPFNFVNVTTSNFWLAKQKFSSSIEIVSNESYSSLTSGLVLYYPFDSNLNDYSTFGRNATASGSPTNVGSCKVGGCYNFSGSAQYLTTPAIIGSNTNYTVSMWVKPDFNASSGFTTGQEPIYHWSLTSSNRNYLRFETATRLVVDTINLGNTTIYWNYTNRCNGLPACDYNPPPAYNRGDWIFLVVSGNQSGLTDKAMYIGSGDGTHSGRYWNGMIDEFAVWNRKLSDAEILELYNNGQGKAIPVNPSTFPKNTTLRCYSNVCSFDNNFTASGFVSSDGSVGLTQTILVNATCSLVYKNGLLTSTSGC